MEEHGLATRKKHARRPAGVVLVFEDESGLSHQPVVRRTWAPRGHPPVLRHPGANWKRLSIAAALAFRWDGRRSRLYFQTRPGTYTDGALIGVLRTLKRHFRGAPIILLWDSLQAPKSARMTRYLARQRPLAPHRAASRPRTRSQPGRAAVGQRQNQGRRQPLPWS
jgi:hypothetical protein